MVTMIIAVLVMMVGAASAAGVVSWRINGLSEPSVFAPSDQVRCESEEKCDRYQLVVANLGDTASSGTVELIDTLPKGLKPFVEPESGNDEEGVGWQCVPNEDVPEQWVISCTFSDVVPVGGYTPFLDIRVAAPAAGLLGTEVENSVTVTGGGAAQEVSANVDTAVRQAQPPFAISQFFFDPRSANANPESQSGGHPWQITSGFQVPEIAEPHGFGTAEKNFRPLENVRSVTLDLPPGLVGDPQVVGRCTETELNAVRCPADSKVGTFAVVGGLFQFGEFVNTDSSSGCCSAVYSLVPDRGYPAEFGLTFAGIPVHLYASVIRSAAGYHLRVTVPDIPSELETAAVAVTFFGDPAAARGAASQGAFLTNPADCAAGKLTSALTLRPWETPGVEASQAAVAYPSIAGCAGLGFAPRLSVAPSASASEGTQQADEPSSFTADLQVPQTEGFTELATPPLRDSVVTLPAGVSISAAAASGLAGCAGTGQDGINLGSDQIAHDGRDEGDPEATELGEGHAGGNGSPYDDGMYHSAPGHCPQASTIGTVEVFTPVLPNGPNGEAPLSGHVYLVEPKCGIASAPACTEASATNGELFGLYLEVSGSGVIVKLAGTVAADPATGQLTATFRDNPQLPFSDLKIHFKGGPRAPLANPQTCGGFTSSSTLTSWAGQESDILSSDFAVSSNGQGGACPFTWPLDPGFGAGTSTAVAKASGVFTLGLSRNDREQDLAGLTVALPPGLLGNISQVPRCPAAQADAGTCGSESLIGSANVTAGSGTEPLPVGGGRVYLSDGYKGAPFGLSIVVPAVAGPFNLGDVVVRAAIRVDPNTSAITVTSDPLPQSRDGVPFRLRTINVAIDRAGFMVNPTNCAGQQVTATISGDQGGQATNASGFAVGGCAGLPLAPSISATSEGKTSKANGASLSVKIGQSGNETNIKAVHLQIPRSLPARLTTLQKACTVAVFDTNPGACPATSIIGAARATTPLLNAPLVGPAYLVSHGGAAFPDVQFLLQGEGVQIDLDGKTDIKKGVTYSNFDSVPDAPISMFETTLPEGPHSIFAANGDLCGQKPAIPTTVVGQNGAHTARQVKVAVTGCAKLALQLKRPVIRHGKVRLGLSLNRAGKLTVVASGVRRLSKNLPAGAQHVMLQLTRKGRAAYRRGDRIKLLVKVTDVTGSVSKVLFFKR